MLENLSRRRLPGLAVLEAHCKYLTWRLLFENKGIRVFESATEYRQFDGLKADTEAGHVVGLAGRLNSKIPQIRITEVHWCRLTKGSLGVLRIN